jgi:exopolysaccharide production protein ExoZ
MIAASGTRPRTVLSIQYLRGIAALMVVLHHARNPQVWLYNPIPESSWGAAGVAVFFVISGFIMYTAARDEPVPTFAWRRFLRVVPLYWVATLGFFAIIWVLNNPLPPGTVKHLVLSLLFVPHWSVTDPGYVWPILVPGWTLNYEMFFYALFAVGLALRRVVLFTSLSILILVGLGLLLGPTDALGLTYTDLRLLPFVFGLWIGVIYARWGMSPLMGLLLPLGFVAVVGLSKEMVLLRGVAAAVVVGALALEQKLKQWHLPKLLGDASYSIYLSHSVTLIFVAEALSRLPLTGPLQFAVAMVIALAAATIVGVTIHWFIERPLLRWASRAPATSRAVGAAP